MRALYVNDVPLDDPRGAWWVHEDTEVHGSPALSGPLTSSSRRHGVSTGRGRFGSGDGMLLVCVDAIDPLTGTRLDYRQRRENEAYLKGLLLDARGPVWLREVYDDLFNPTGIETRVQVTNRVEVREATVEVSLLSFPLSIVDAFWRDLTEQTTGDLALLRGGSAPIVDPIIRIPGTDAGVYRVTDQVTGAWVEWRGIVPTGSYILLDVANETGHVVTSATWTPSGSAMPANVWTSAGGFEIHPLVQLTMPANTQIKARRAFL